jgi:aspartate racemase
MTRVIGILGGISPASTAEYYDKLIAGYYARKGDAYYPEIVIFSLNFQRFTDYEDGDRDKYIYEILKGIRSLERAGADFIAMAANSPHSVYKEVAAEANVPILSIVEVTAREAVRRKLKRLLLLGIQHTMRSTFYQETFAKHKIDVITPSEVDQIEVNRIIFEELSLTQFKPETKQRLIDIISRYDVEGVILGCTELPLILQANDVSIQMLDTMDLHVRAILDEAL